MNVVVAPAVAHPGAATRLAGRCGSFVVEHERLCLGASLVLFASIALYRVFSVPIWFDECFTLFISRLNSLGGMLRAMPADSQPPLQYLLTHAMIRALGESELAIRLPELAAYLGAALLVFRIVRRHGSAVQGLFAVFSFLGCTLNSD